MQSRIRVTLVHIAGETGRLDPHVFKAREFKENVDAGSEILALPLNVEAHVVDDDAQIGMARRDLADLGDCEGGEDHDRNIVAFALSPKPVRRAVIKKGGLSAVTNT